PIRGVRALVDAIAVAAEIDPAAACAGELSTWPMLEEMKASGLVEIGCHTVNHPVLANETAADAHSEMSEARARIAERLGAAPRHFAYPYGQPGQADAREFALARNIGFATAVTTRQASLFALHLDHVYRLPRVEVSAKIASAPHYLRAILAGLPLV